MKVCTLIDILKEFKADDTVAIGKIFLLGGGLSAVIDRGDVYVCKISDTVIIHTSKPKEGPEWRIVKGEENEGLKDALITDFS